MIVAGLTGSIAMGKSTVAAMLAALGAPVFDADVAVRAFYGGEGAEAVGRVFDGVVVDGVVDRQKLSARVVGDEAAMKRLESIVHPAVAAARRTFLARAAAEGRRMAVVDVPLLFETAGDADVDLVVVVSAPYAVQKRRALARPGMTAQKFAAIFARQTPDAVKRRRAHVVIDTGANLEDTADEVRQFLRAAAALPGRRDAHA